MSRIIDPKRLRSAGDNHDHMDGRAEIKTAMPGKVVRILVESGAEVAKGDGIIVVEAMKMQNELKSPKDGIVREIRAADGDTVNAGEVLRRHRINSTVCCDVLRSVHRSCGPCDLRHHFIKQPKR